MRDTQQSTPASVPSIPPQWNQQPFFYPSMMQQGMFSGAPQHYDYQQQPQYMHPYQSNNFIPGNAPQYQNYHNGHFQQGPRFTAEGYGISATAQMDAPLPVQHTERRAPRISEEVDCFTCNRQFPNKVQLLGHRAREHIKCPENGCTFEADVSTLSRHKREKHSCLPSKPVVTVPDGPPLPPGVIPAIEGTNIKLDTPEAIAKWREDRKKRWPSAAVVAQKAENTQSHERSNSSSKSSYASYDSNQGPRGSSRGRGRGRGSFAPQERGRGWGNRGRGGRGSHHSAMYEEGADAAQNEPEPKRQKLDSHHSEPPLEPTRSTQSQDTSRKTILTGYGTPSEEDEEADSAPEIVSTAKAAHVKPEEPSDSGEGSSDSDEVTAAALLEARKYAKGAPSSSDSDSNSESDSEQEAVPVKAVEVAPRAMAPKPAKNRKKGPAAPKPIHNPFEQKHSLLSKLVANDVAKDVSDLLQVAEFLVRNDFLQHVELRPGEADEEFGIEEVPQ